MIRLILLTCIVLSSCGSEQTDLDAYFAEVKARPVGDIEEIEEYPPYKAFVYQAMNLRAPFEPPEKIVDIEVNFTPDAMPVRDRNRMPLENYSVDELEMVGLLSSESSSWGLVKDPIGLIHKVSVGDYLGKFDGKVSSITNSYLAFIELVPAGEGRWRERPRSLVLKNSESDDE